MSPQPVTAVIVGAGHRSMVMAGYALQKPDELRIVGVADPDELRRRRTAEEFGLVPEQCYESAEQLAVGPKAADAVINGTMDHQHVPTSLPLLEAGYDILLEKPFATNEEEMLRLAEVCKRHKRKLMVCHVLRYAPFYLEIRKRVATGKIGEILNIQINEHVSYHHMSVAFVRGKWNRQGQCHSTMLLAKCCHDLDMLAWMKSGVAPVSVASFGGLTHFRPENAPQGAGTRCLVDCPAEAQCEYSARKIYLEHPKRWRFYVWAGLEHIEEPTMEDMERSLRTDNPHGRCAWKCGNDVVDHQSVAVEFADGAIATHNMVGGTAKPLRSIHIVGTKGEIQGEFEASRFAVRTIAPRPGNVFDEEVVDLNVSGDMAGAFGGHGGGDLRLVADFVRLIRGEEPSISCTSIEDSIHGHQMVFCADRSREEGRVVPVPVV